MNRTIAIMCISLLVAGQAFGSGILLPKDKSLPALAIKYQRVDIDIKDAVATARIEQVFKNSVDRDLEAVYIFPLPENAAIAEFAMYINGKRMHGELVEKDKARKIYQDIVRRMRDPGLLEHLGGSLFRVSVYPVPRNGEQKIEISYSQTLPYESGMYHYLYPLKTTDKASRTLDDFTVRVDLHSTEPLKTIYSPSHEVGISRKSDHHAVIGFEEDRSLLDRDFSLFYGISRKDFGLNLLTHAPEKGDGYFMMLISPNVAPGKGEVIQRDLTFVFDTSGSMSGDKIRQARKSLEYCVNGLNEGDRFNLVRFSTDVETLSDSMLEVNDANREKALEFVSDLRARGGTDIQAALAAAMRTKRDGSRPHNIVFLTDGRPTLGETDIEMILKDVDEVIAKRTRIFVFGVGDDVNTHLLDQLSADHGGTSQYVRPGEDIEVNVSSFYDKISHPVLGSLKISVDKIKTHSFHPQALPDLFAGNQITLFGRYEGDGHVAIRLSGEINGKPREFVYEATFAGNSADNDFIPRLWGTRRVGYLLDEIRLHGEAKELKDEVMRLSKEFGIMTPYTSYLVLESDEEYAKHDIARKANELSFAGRLSARKSAAGTRRDKNGSEGLAAAAPGPAGRHSIDRRASVVVPVLESSADAVRELGEASGSKVRGYSYKQKEQERSRRMHAQVGGDAVDYSEALDSYRRAEVNDDRIALTVRRVGRRIFYQIEGVWTDRDYKTDMERVTVKYNSDEYFELLDRNPGLKKVFALGDRIVVVLEDRAIVVEP